MNQKYNCFKHIVEENIRQRFWLKNKNKAKKLFPWRNREQWIDE